MKKSILVLILALCMAIKSVAQVNDIKNASRENASKKSGSSATSDRGNNSGGGNLFFILDMFRIVGTWQNNVLDKRTEIPSIVGLDCMLHGAIQPSSYYVFNPRVRGTWGIFSTDFRTNYLVEQTINGNSDLLTYDWQILQLNFINTRNVIVRAGTGFMKENYGGYGSFMEFGLSTNLTFSEGEWGGFAEYRAAKDFVTEMVPRREFSLQVHKQLFDAGRWHALASGGFQFQRYYESINVWGIQMGLIFRLY